MGLFQGGTCALCGNKTGIVSLTTRDRQEVCIDCMMKKQIPSKYQKYIEELWTLDEMLHYPDYDARRKELCRVFPEDYYNLENPFGNLYVDNEHEMFAVVNGFGAIWRQKKRMFLSSRMLIIWSLSLSRKPIKRECCPTRQKAGFICL